MARTLATIETSLDTNISNVITNPSGSIYAEWKLWRSIFAAAVWAFEKLLDAFKTEVEVIVSSKQPGTFDWYYEKIMEFQGETIDGVFQGDTLIVEGGIIKYSTVDSTRCIIKKASLRASTGSLAVKVAKESALGQLIPLSSSEQLALTNYLAAIKYPGTVINVISLAADSITYNLNIVYDPIYTTATVQANVLAALETFRLGMGFDDRFYSSKFVEAILAAEGVKAVKITTLTGWDVTSNTTTAIDIVRTLIAGYFNYNASSALTFTSYKTYDA
jgi:hypothetical protein